MSKYRAVPKPTEHQEQVAVIEFWASYAPTKGLPVNLLFCIPNASRLTPAGRIYKWKEGLRAGVPDLFLAKPKFMQSWEKTATAGAGAAGTFTVSMVFHGMFIEMKRIGEKARPEQIAFADMLRKQGYNCVIAQGADEAIRAIKAYIEK